MIAATLLATAAAMQGVDQIPQPPHPAQAGATRSSPSDLTRVAQLPPDAKAVDQLQPQAVTPPVKKADVGTDDAARAYATILGTGGVALRSGASDLGVRTLAEAAAAANLSNVPATAPTQPLHGTPKS